jgi:hypothetical protein
MATARVSHVVWNSAEELPRPTKGGSGSGIRTYDRLVNSEQLYYREFERSVPVLLANTGKRRANRGGGGYG